MSKDKKSLTLKKVLLPLFYYFKVAAAILTCTRRCLYAYYANKPKSTDELNIS